MRTLTLAALLLALMVIALGAYTRLTEAGLGCPDWPGCYGRLLVPNDSHRIEINEDYPDIRFEPHKARNEMVHRYLAGALGVMIAIITVLAWWWRRQRWLASGLLGLVLFQAALGMWTVTLNLMPLVVMGHLLGGFSTAALLLWLWLRLGRQSRGTVGAGTSVSRRRWMLLGGMILMGQIMLGGWTSANYASLVCTELPICQGRWWQQLEPERAFALVQPAADSYQFGTLDYPARMTIHVSHRIWAAVTASYLLVLAIGAWRRSGSMRSSKLKPAAGVLLLLLGVQVSLGLGNVLLSLPLAVAVAHNLTAALLLLTLVWMGFYQREQRGGCNGQS